jgi:hypothetical protein
MHRKDPATFLMAARLPHRLVRAWAVFDFDQISTPPESTGRDSFVTAITAAEFRSGINCFEWLRCLGLMRCLGLLAYRVSARPVVPVAVCENLRAPSLCVKIFDQY